MKTGQGIQLFNGHGHKAEASIKSISSQNVVIDVEEVTKETRELPLLILACAIPKKGKFETIIEKSTELGIDEIIPLRTKNTEVVFNAERGNTKILRYQKVAVNAAKQSKRTTIPVIHPVTEFKTALDILLNRSVVIIPSLTENRKKLMTTLEQLKTPAVVSLLIGPEGDFTPQEYATAHGAGCLPVSLGKTILKVETAAITAVAVTRLFFHG